MIPAAAARRPASRFHPGTKARPFTPSTTSATAASRAHRASRRVGEEPADLAAPRPGQPLVRVAAPVGEEQVVAQTERLDLRHQLVKVGRAVDQRLRPTALTPGGQV